MEKIQQNRKGLLGQCHTYLGSIDASNIGSEHGTVIGNMGASIFHFDGDIKIKDGEGFILEATKAMKSLIEMIRNNGAK